MKRAKTRKDDKMEADSKKRRCRNDLMFQRISVVLRRIFERYSAFGREIIRLNRFPIFDKKIDPFLSRVSTLTRDIDIANLSVCPSVCLSVRPSVRNVPVSDENSLTYRHSFFTIR